MRACDFLLVLGIISLSVGLIIPAMSDFAHCNKPGTLEVLGFVAGILIFVLFLVVPKLLQGRRKDGKT